MDISQGGSPGPGRVLRAAVFVATILVLVALAILPLLTPPFIHPALDAAGSATFLGMDRALAQEMSDRSVAELVAGTGAFEIRAPDGSPFYDDAERRHLADARVLLWGCLLLGVLSLLGITLALLTAAPMRRRRMWRTISRAGATVAIAVIALGAISLVAFEPLFSLFHQVFFPGGNWAFDAATQHLVQLYPFAFWQIASAALGLLLAVLGVGTWWLGRSQAGRSSRAPAPVLAMSGAPDQAADLDRG